MWQHFKKRSVLGVNIKGGGGDYLYHPPLKSCQNIEAGYIPHHTSLGIYVYEYPDTTTTQGRQSKVDSGEDINVTVS